VESNAEQQLVTRAKGGDTLAFEAILAPLIDPAHRFACALLRDPALAEDAVQEASVRAWRKLSRLRPGNPLRPWFLGIVANQCRDQMRARWWQVIRMPQPRVTSSHLPEDVTLRRAELREALMKLRDPERRVLVLRLYLDLPWTEVATAAGVTEAGARSRYYRAMDRLRALHGSEEALT
jgi:RNA polymerase sigma-70 factor, ECF subfamily